MKNTNKSIDSTQKKSSMRKMIPKIAVTILAFVLVIIFSSIYADNMLNDMHEHDDVMGRVIAGIAIFGLTTAVALIISVSYIDTHKEKVIQADEYAQLMLDATPLGCSLWKSNAEMIDCNLESLKLFNVSNKKEFKEKFFELSPEFQPCGMNSKEKARYILEKAFQEGYYRSDWVHMTSEGELIPSEIVLVRIKHKGNDIVAAYIRDLRELNTMLDAMHKVEDDLRLALFVAEDNAKAKSEFLDNMNHELRTPMNGIIGFLRMALQSDMPEKSRGFVNSADSSAKDLLKIINDVLDFTEIEDKKMELNAVPFKLTEIIEEVTETFARAIEAKDLDFNVRVPSDLPEILVGDPHKLRQVLTILIDNAIKFTEKGKITLRAKINRNDADQVEMEFYVKDTGIGIKPEHMNSLFMPFSQVDGSATRKVGGTGLGLALSKHLTALLGGSIRAESEYEEGSTFYFTARFDIPEARELSAEMPGEPGDMPGVKTVGNAHDPNNTRLLVVEDNEVNRFIAEEVLMSVGYMVDTANDGLEALDMIQQNDYHAVLMDIQMPVMDGLTATKRIREMEQYKDLPIIALSAHAMPEDKEKSLNSGMNDHLTKPIDPDTLRAALGKWLSQAA